MVVFSAREIILLALFLAFGVAKAEFEIVEPYPEIIYPIEYTSAQVTCVAYDSSGVKVPDTILFVRRDDFNNYVNLTDDGNLYFTRKTEENGRKLFVTMHIRNVTMKDDSTNKLGNYECHAYAVNHYVPARYGFSVNVVTVNEIPKVVVSEVKLLEHDMDASILCNMTERGSQDTRLVKVSWFKDGVVNRTVLIPNPPNSNNPLGPFVLEDVGVKDGGEYTCLLEVLLQNKRPYNVTDSTVISIAPWFEHEGEKEIVKEIGEGAKLECSAKGFPLNVEWKFKNESDEVVKSCISSSTNKRYNVTRKGIYDPYYLAVSDLVTTDTGSYYCCLPSNCSESVDEDRCQRFVLTVGVAPWFEHEGEKEIVKEIGGGAKLECSAKGFPLNVEWKFKNESDEVVKSCIGSSTNKRYNVTRKGIYDPYYLAVSDLVTTDTGSYYCCLPSNCSESVDEDRCQRFVLTVEDPLDPKGGTMALALHGVLAVLATFLASSLLL
ncbi:immunoglobulin superfamily member 10-like isoform X1 [Oculina patagonica]